MKKTHEDRIKLIDRLERKYQDKVRTQKQERRQGIKKMLRNIKERRSDFEYASLDYIDEIFSRGPKTA